MSCQASAGVMNGAGITSLMHAMVTGATAPDTVRTFRGTPRAVAAAREFVRGALPGCPRIDDLVLAASELATNVIDWSASGQGGTFLVRIRTAPRWARLEVTDAGPALEPTAASTGLGLRIVAEVTDRTGKATAPDGSRTAWAEITWP